MRLHYLTYTFITSLLLLQTACTGETISESNSSPDRKVVEANIPEGAGETREIEWTIDGQRTVRLAHVKEMNSQEISAVSFPRELLLSRGMPDTMSRDSKIALVEVKLNRKLADYQKLHQLSDDDLMKYLAFELQHHFYGIDQKDSIYKAEGIIYEPSHGVRNTERFIVFLGDIPETTYTLVYEDDFFGFGRTELRIID